MVSKPWRVAALAAGIVGMSTVMVTTASSAQASGYTTNVIGPISSQAACAADAAAANDPPNTLTSACRFSATYPGTSVPDAGWYYNIHILIS